MRYTEIIGYPREFNRNTYSIVGDIRIESQFLAQPEGRAADQMQIKVVGHDEALSGTTKPKMD
jgi:hypothetical protein